MRFYGKIPQPSMWRTKQSTRDVFLWHFHSPGELYQVSANFIKFYLRSVHWNLKTCSKITIEHSIPFIDKIKNKISVCGRKTTVNPLRSTWFQKENKIMIKKLPCVSEERDLIYRLLFFCIKLKTNKNYELMCVSVYFGVFHMFLVRVDTIRLA